MAYNRVFPGYNGTGGDLPPRPVCAKTWHGSVMKALGTVRLRVIIESYALKRHLGWKGRANDAVIAWGGHGPDTFVLRHPSWRNTGWLRRNPFFEDTMVPALQTAVQKALSL